MAEELLEFFHREDERHGRLNIHIATLYKAFEKEAPYEMIQRAIEFLLDRDLIAPSSYGLTAKGRREHSLKQKS